MLQKKNEGILFSAEIRVVGSYTDRLLTVQWRSSAAKKFPIWKSRLYFICDGRKQQKSRKLHNAVDIFILRTTMKPIQSKWQRNSMWGICLIVNFSWPFFLQLL